MLFLLFYCLLWIEGAVAECYGKEPSVKLRGREKLHIGLFSLHLAEFHGVFYLGTPQHQPGNINY